MFGGTLCACAVLALAYFAWRGTQLVHLPIVLDGDYLMTPDDELGFVATPNGSTVLRNVETDARFHIFTDRRGARVDAAGAQTGPTVDVMALGCSFTWGSGIESEQTWVQQLHAMTGATVANFAMGSYGSVQSLLLLMRNADLKPKVVVYAFIPDHVRRNVNPCAPNFLPYCLPVAYLQRQGDQIVLRPPPTEVFSVEENRDFMRDVATRPLDSPAALWLRTTWAATIAFRTWLDRTVSVDRSPETATHALRAMVSAMAEETRKIGARFVVLNMPYLTRGQLGSMPPELQSAIAGLDVTLVDFAPVAAAWYAAHPTGSLVLDDDPHPNPAAQRMIAETVAAAVRPLLEAR